MTFPMHPAGPDTLDPCDHCGNLHKLDDMTLVNVFRGTFIDPPEDILICDDCLGETE